MNSEPLPRTRESVDWWLKHWGRDAVLSGDEPMSREDLKRLMSVNGGTAEGLDLTFRNLQSADLSEINLREIRLREAALGHTNLRETNLFRANLQGAELFRADLRGAFLMQADMQGAHLLAVRIDDQTNLDDVEWGHDYINAWERDKIYNNARSIYRQLNTWHQNHGLSDIAGEFLYREWVCKRLEAQEGLTSELSWRHPWRVLLALNLHWWRNLIVFLWLGTHELLFGYGERPIRVVLTACLVVLGFAVVYFLYPPSELSNAGWGELLARMWYSFYFSLVSFTTLGYGEWIKHPDNWLRYLGGVQSFIGLFLTALFLVTFTRKWTK